MYVCHVVSVIVGVYMRLVGMEGWWGLVVCVLCLLGCVVVSVLLCVGLLCVLYVCVELGVCVGGKRLAGDLGLVVACG